jgi:hypothetical protein
MNMLMRCAPSIRSFTANGWDEHVDALCPIHSQHYREWVG